MQFTLFESRLSTKKISIQFSLWAGEKYVLWNDFKWILAGYLKKKISTLPEHIVPIHSNKLVSSDLNQTSNNLWQNLKSDEHTFYLVKAETLTQGDWLQMHPSLFRLNANIFWNIYIYFFLSFHFVPTSHHALLYVGKSLRWIHSDLPFHCDKM